MNEFWAKFYTAVVRNPQKRRYICDILTNKTDLQQAIEATKLAQTSKPARLSFSELQNFEKNAKGVCFGCFDTKLQAQNAYKVLQLKAKVKAGEKIKVGFYIIEDNAFPFKSLFELMLQEEIFDPYVVICVTNGDSEFRAAEGQVAKLSAVWGERVLRGYDPEVKEPIDIAKNFDLIATSQPYEEIWHKFYTIKRAVSTGALVLFTGYAMGTASWNRDRIVTKPALNLCWRVFVDTHYGLKEYQTLTLNRGKNAFLTGYVKMDQLAKIAPQKRARKRVIIAPHHTIAVQYNSALQLSNFFRYSEFFFTLFEKYPQIDFIFRPHPLLLTALRKPEYWGEQKAEAYFARFKAVKNAVFENRGEYYESFVNSDGIIHDCGSFIGEYLYTDHPCCYMLKEEQMNEKNLAEFGKECINHYYHAYDEAGIERFLDEVVLAGRDLKKEARVKFANEVVKVNYPHAAKVALELVKRQFV